MSGRLVRLGMRVVHVCAAALLVALAGTPRAGQAAEWPTRTVTLTQTFAGGGTMDFAVRSIAQAMTESFSQPFVVETKAGGSGLVGLLATAKAPPEGYDFVVTAIGPMVFRPMLEKDLGFDADKA